MTVTIAEIEAGACKDALEIVEENMGHAAELIERVQDELDKYFVQNLNFPALFSDGNMTMYEDGNRLTIENRAQWVTLENARLLLVGEAVV